LLTIERAEVLVTSPGRNFVTLKIETSDGVTGLGDATLNGRELAVASYLSNHVVPLLTGRDPHKIEDTWQYPYRTRRLEPGIPTPPPTCQSAGSKQAELCTIGDFGAKRTFSPPPG
jgi:L-alanine-DL-glutamate epimerase-like enolase superfamily enzyme